MGNVSALGYLADVGFPVTVMADVGFPVTVMADVGFPVTVVVEVVEEEETS